MGFHKLRSATLAAALVVAGVALVASPATAAITTKAGAVQAADPAGTLTSDVTGSFTDASGAPGTVTGTFVPSSFDVVNDQIIATGTLTATLTDAAGAVLGTETTTAALPLVSATSDQSGAVSAAPITCQVLDLVLGPLDLDLLGLVVHLDRVHLNITAVPGAGDLLGNLLCAVVNLLNGGLPGVLGQVAALLAQILALLAL